MIVPSHWAEARATARVKGRTVTLRRFGWSDTSAADAQAQAELRVAEAAQRAERGEDVPRRDRKLTYNGAQGLPIREEVLSRHGDAVITRNTYGARCLNVPDLLIADVDVDPPRTGRPLLVIGMLLLLPVVALLVSQKVWPAALAGVLILLLGPSLLKRLNQRARAEPDGDPADAARRRVAGFVAQHPDWRLRVYRTPAGLRLIATHARFAPTSDAVQAFFQAIGADPVYVQMCRAQHCFRARLTAKPWRIGIADHLKPRPGVWPIKPERLPDRQAWVQRYERAAEGHAACHYLETLGQGAEDPTLQPLVALHDDASKALEAGRPLA